MLIVLVLEMRVASYWRVEVLKPVHASVVNAAPLSVPSIFSSTKSPFRSDRMVDVPLLLRPGAPGFNQNVISTSHVPHISASRACSGAGRDIRVSVRVSACGPASTVVAAAVVTTTSAASAYAQRFIGTPSGRFYRQSPGGAIARISYHSS